MQQEQIALERQIEALLCELYALREEVIRIVQARV